jgi:hypothetical protein
MVALNLDVLRSEIVCSVFERLPITAVAPVMARMWHAFAGQHVIRRDLQPYERCFSRMARMACISSRANRWG